MSGKELATHVQKVNGQRGEARGPRSAVLDVSECWRQCHRQWDVAPASTHPDPETRLRKRHTEVTDRQRMQPG